MIQVLEPDRSVLTEYEWELFHEMFKHRKRVFTDRLGWVASNGEIEYDDFDHNCAPIYLVSVDEAGKYRGSLRLLPLTGPTMLYDTFPQLLGPDPLPIDPYKTWESSRICVESPGVLRELIMGIGEVLKPLGASEVVSVFDRRMRVLLRRTGIDFSVPLPPQDVNGVETCVGFFPIPEDLSTAQAKLGFDSPVLCRASRDVVLND